MVAPYSILKNLQSQLSLNTGICLVLIPTVPVYDFSTANRQLRLWSCSGPLWRQSLGEQALKETFSFSVVFCSFFLVSPVACQLWGIEYRIILCRILRSQKERANYERKSTMAYYCCPPTMLLVPSFIVLLATETLFV